MKLSEVAFLGRIASVVLLLVSSSAPVLADEQSPKAQMETVMNEVIEIVEQLPGEDNKDSRHSKMREVITPRFDFEEMAKRSLGSYWLKTSEKERSEFVDLFSELLARTYLSRIDNVERGMVSLDSERIKKPKALVKSTVDYKGDSFPIDYKLLYRDAEGWKVYDVIIENIGLVANYRSEFAGVIRKEKFSGLLKRLRNKLEGDPA